MRICGIQITKHLNPAKAVANISGIAVKNQDRVRGPGMREEPAREAGCRPPSQGKRPDTEFRG